MSCCSCMTRRRKDVRDYDEGMVPRSADSSVTLKGKAYSDISLENVSVWRCQSFGVVLLELITGRKAIDCTKKPGEQILVVWSRPFLKDRRKFVQMVDPLLEGHYPVRFLHHAVAIAAMCLHEQPSFRPIVDDIVVALEYLASQTDSPDSYKGHYDASISSPGRDTNLGPRKPDLVNLSAAF